MNRKNNARPALMRAVIMLVLIACSIGAGAQELYSAARLDGRYAFGVPATDKLGGGGGAELELRKLFGTGFYGALAVDYSSYLPADQWVESLMFGSAFLRMGYRVDLSEYFTLAPYAAAGISLGRLSSARNGAEAETGTYSASAGTQVLSELGLGMDWNITRSQSLSFRPSYRLLAEKSDVYHTLGLSLGYSLALKGKATKNIHAKSDTVGTSQTQPLPQPLARLDNEENIRVLRESSGIRIIIEGSFVRNEAALNDELGRQLDMVAELIRDEEPRLVRVEGYVAADAEAGTDAEISLVRASAARNSLLSSAWLAAAPIPIEAKGMGRENPVASNDSEEGRARNRRVEIILESR